jgi:hypothetical protein
VVVYLVRPTISAPPGATLTAAKISLQKSTSMPFLAKLFNLAAAPPKTVSAVVQKLKVTTKKIALPIAAKKSVKAATKKQVTVKQQGKRVTVKAVTKKIAGQKMTTKKKKIIARTTMPTLKATTSAEEEEAVPVTITETDLEDGTKEPKKVTINAPETSKITTTAPQVDEAAMFEVDESSGMYLNLKIYLL